MKLLIYLLLTVLFFTGCSQNLPSSVPNYSIYKTPTVNITNTNVENLNEQGDIFKVTNVVDGKVNKKGAMLMVIGALQKAVVETEQRGYRYFQIISPSSLSNTSGFPINTIADLTAYLIPQANNVPKGYNGLINAIETHSALGIPLTVFGESKFEIVVRTIKEPNYFDIVWDTNKY